MADNKDGNKWCRDCPLNKTCLKAELVPITPYEKRQRLLKIINEAELTLDNRECRTLFAYAELPVAEMVDCCSIFSERLRGDPKLAEHIKDIMVNWNARTKSEI